MRRYPAYKDTGLEWVGKVPDGWSILPALAVGYERLESNAGMLEDNLLSLSYGRIVRKDIEGLDGLLPESFETYQIVHPGDIVLRLTDLQNDKRSLRSAIVRERGIITSAYLAFAPKNVDCNYLSYLLRAYDLSKVFYSMGGGLRQGMKFADIKRMPVLLPPLSEQTAIAAFLDRETAKIDALVAEQRRLIELLREKRQAVISHAVTKGLNPNARMKPSGIDWLGDVPEEWKVRPIKSVAKLAGRIGYRGYTTADIVDEGEGAVTLSPSNIRAGVVSFQESTYISWTKYEESPEIQLAPHDVVMVKTGSTFGKVGYISASSIPAATINPQLVIFKEIACHSEYLFLSLHAAHLRSRIEVSNTGGTIPTMTQEAIGNFRVALPPRPEQQMIVDHVRKATGNLDTLTATAETAITLLQERRAALISAAVTGKIDVRQNVTDEVAA